MNEERDFYAEVRQLVEEWADDLGGDIDSVRSEVETILDDAEEEFS
ncbi:hypothetical protein [Alteromonas phage ZP6]|uniref:Uncharacterized protein n=1 Tax=Alteromonas phage ZP6 TaxID=2492447 RepID=A0A3S9U8D8_9CAUD|nr:hypothetical protein PQC03_gp27 [Alteromonas phage ZP6]AZS06530.1 hypothetical protein [Alteromonas phage ZP6]